MSIGIVGVISIVVMAVMISIWSSKYTLTKKLVLTLCTITIPFIIIPILFIWGFESGRVPHYEQVPAMDSTEYVINNQPSTNSSQNTSLPMMKNDTTFLLEEKGDDFQHSIFIETNRQSEIYNQISNFKFDEYDEDHYKHSLKYLKENKIDLSSKTITGVPLKWIALYQYKGEFYTYKPCDFMSHYQVAITNSAFIDYGGEGPVANKIIDFKKINDNTFKFQLTGMYVKNRTLTIHIIDGKNGIAIFEENTDNEGSDFRLMISADKIRKFPIIVNSCEGMKQGEFEFDEPNFEELLRNSKNQKS